MERQQTGQPGISILTFAAAPAPTSLAQRCEQPPIAQGRPWLRYLSRFRAIIL